MRRAFLLLSMVFLFMLGSLTALAQNNDVYTGYMGNDVSDEFYPLQLGAGQGVIVSAVTTSGDLDPYVFLLDANEEEVASNDDRDATTLNSYLLYIAQEAGQYTVRLTNISGTSGDFELTISVVSADRIYAEYDALRPQFSGPVQTLDSANFRIHFTTAGIDAADPAFVQQMLDTFELVYTAQITEFGWPAPPTDGLIGGDRRYDVYVLELDTPEAGEYGATWPELTVGDNPATLPVESFAVISYMTMDNNYEYEDIDDPLRLMQATAAHEFHHAIQFGYDETDDNWFYEATATYMESVTLPGIEEATPYVTDLYTYPEVCIGAEGDADPTGNLLMYGHWLFVDTLVTAHGAKFLPELWANLAIESSWRALELTLEPYGDTIPAAVERYHLNNLVRDYKLAVDFNDATVWIEGVIEQPGAWTFSGEGIQELAANYFELILPPDTYAVELVSDGSEISNGLKLWAVGIKDDQAAAFDLGVGGAIDTRDWEYMYLVVVNPAYDADLLECAYTGYDITIEPGAKSAPVEAAFALNAANFLPTK